MSTTETSGGLGLCSAMFLLFLGLKLADVIDWSWVWVTAPLWIPAILAAIAVLVACVLALVVD